MIWIFTILAAAILWVLANSYPLTPRPIVTRTTVESAPLYWTLILLPLLVASFVLWRFCHG